MIYTARLVAYQEGLSRLSYDHTPLTCSSCGGPVHQVLTVPGAHIGRERELYRVVRCLNCMFWGAYYVYFDEADRPTRVIEGVSREPAEFLEHGAWPQLAASLAWSAGPPNPEYDGSPTVAGGDPDWVEEEERAVCPECGRPMEFVLQLSSWTMDGWRDELGASLGDNRWPSELGYRFTMAIEYYATLYFFACDSCRVTCSITQSS